MITVVEGRQEWRYFRDETTTTSAATSPAYATPRVSRHRLVADAELNRVFFPRNPHRRNEQYTVGRNTRSERARDSS